MTEIRVVLAFVFVSFRSFQNWKKTDMGRNLFFVLFLILIAEVSMTSKLLDEEKLDKIIENVMECRENVAFNLAVVKGKDIILTKGYGKSNIEKNKTMTADTVLGN